jgi:hypothetical protein
MEKSNERLEEAHQVAIRPHLPRDGGKSSSSSQVGRLVSAVQWRL